MGNGQISFDPASLKARYVEERGRRLRSDGNDQYCSVTEARPELLADPFDRAPFERDSVEEMVDVLIVGGGMSGIMTGGALRKAGVESIRLLEAASGFGGTWYWNRYPGAACDTEAYIYMPGLEDTGYVPTTKYASGPELHAYFNRLAAHYGLTERTLFRTRAKALRWDEGARRWIVTTDRGDTIRARFVSLSAGTLAQPKLPAIPGIDTFRGKIFLTARWDYDYTGGSPEKPEMTKLADKTVAIVGTGATAIQAVPPLARSAGRLLVFQRTPAMVNERGNRPTEPDFAAGLKPGWQRERVRNFELNVAAVPDAKEDLVADGWTRLARDLSNVERVRHLAAAGESDPGELPQLADFATMETARARVHGSVTAPHVAEALKPWYNVHCKRPTFHDEFLPAFNRENVTLVDTGGKGIERVTGTGIVTNGEEYPVDCIIFSTGFEYLSLHHQTGRFSVEGVDGRSLADKWSGPFRSLHGVFTHGFPNLAFVGQIRDGAGSFNASYPFTLQAEHVGALVGRWLADGVERVEPTHAAEEGWAATMAAKVPAFGTFYADCTPGHLNNEGDPTAPVLRTVLYGGGMMEYEDLLADWREDGVERDMSIERGEARA